MYYLVVTNLGKDRCIHCSQEDIYTEGMSVSCTPAMGFPGGELVRHLHIRCTEAPEPPIRARVYSGPAET